MDPITLAINGLNIEWLTTISLLLDSSLIFALVICALVLIFEKGNDKKIKLFIAILLAFLLGTAIKSITQIPRPCDELVLKTECDGEYSLPSLHMIIAFTLALGFLDDRKFPLFLLFALFVAFTRLYLGVHTFVDVAASLALSPIVYGLVDTYWKTVKEKVIK